MLDILFVTTNVLFDPLTYTYVLLENLKYFRLNFICIVNIHTNLTSFARYTRTRICKYHFQVEPYSKMQKYDKYVVWIRCAILSENNIL